MIKNMAALEVKTGDRVYQFVCSNDSPLGEIQDAIIQMRAYIFERIKQVNEELAKAEKKDEQPASS